MEYNVQRISPFHNFAVTGVSYIGNPKPHTAMYITVKVGELIKNLEGIWDCLIFAESGLVVPADILSRNCFIFTDFPQRDYARFANDFYVEWFTAERKRKYTYTDGGYYIGENVSIGLDAYIEPGCLIGHDVVIGDHVRILSGTIIKKAVIGDDVLMNENGVIGAFGFTMAEDENGNRFRIPTLGRVCIGNYVEIGACDNISCGSGGDTIIEDYVKLDALIHIGHDVYLGKNVEITAGSIIGGFARLEDHSYVGINASVRNRISLGKNSIIGMGATVTKSVESGMTVAGNPAGQLTKRNKV